MFYELHKDSALSILHYYLFEYSNCTMEIISYDEKVQGTRQVFKEYNIIYAFEFMIL